MPQTTTPEAAAYGPYSLVASLLNGRLSIRRQDADRRRTVAIVDTLAQWDRFVGALKAGDDEVSAVHAIDGS